MDITESDWLTGQNPYTLSLHITKGSPRKLRLFAVACCRRIPPDLIDDNCRRLIEASEASAEDRIAPLQRRAVEPPVEELAQKLEEAASLARSREDWTDVAYRRYQAVAACDMTSQANRYMIRAACEYASDAVADPQAEKLYQCDLLREIYGNPFQPVTFQPQWRTAEVLDLARQIDTANYDAEKTAALYPALADALARAECNQADFLAHCRVPASHVRGCWVLDLVLEKK